MFFVIVPHDDDESKGNVQTDKWVNAFVFSFLSFLFYRIL